MKFDGTVASLGEGSYGRLGHGGSENETNLRVISALQGKRSCVFGAVVECDSITVPEFDLFACYCTVATAIMNPYAADL